MDDTDEILVFKTNLNSQRDCRRIRPLLNELTQIRRWNVDLADCDKVLRVQTLPLPPEQVIARLLRVGYSCEELPD